MRWLKPWSASSGAQKSARTTPERSSANAAAAKTTGLLFRNDVLKACPGENRKNEVVQREKGQVTAGFFGHRSAHASDDDRDAERQEEERQQQLPRPRRSGHRREQRADAGDPDVRQHDRGEQLPADRLEEERVGRQRDQLGDAEEGEDAEALAQPDGAAVGRRE